ncbi:M23 family metallopeptidase [Xanthomonas sp. MUS 060]|uniref:M23 family metallopeptidase n=1 Tax=Xanthomonas sp. MUS 060 TaxID=1588031 RepID=UPI0006977D32|nr:M23 family metallopeptidase [Xanthomonas sp. MUS 060]
MAWLLALAWSTCAQTLLRWNAPHPVAHTAPTWLTVTPRRNGLREIWLGNPLGGPVQIRLYGEVNGFKAIPALPRDIELAAGERRLASCLYPLDGGTDASGASADLHIEAIPGSPHAHAEPVLYQLPFKGVPIRIDQGFGGGFSHHDPANFYALDFALPEGTPILAAREGVVMEIRDDFRESGTDAARLGQAANLVRIVHADGSMALYAHLTAGGVQVRVGQSVQRGERLGLSGNSGLTTAPHLHFVVQLNRGLRLESVPLRMTGPLGELRFAHPDLTEVRHGNRTGQQTSPL